MNATADIYERRQQAAVALAGERDLAGRNYSAPERVRAAVLAMARIEHEFATLMGPHGFQSFVAAANLFAEIRLTNDAVAALRRAKETATTDEAARWIESEIHKIRWKHLEECASPLFGGARGSKEGDSIAHECNWGRHYRPRETPCPKRTTGAVAGFKPPPDTDSAILKLCDEHQETVRGELVAQGYDTKIHR